MLEVAIAEARRGWRRRYSHRRRAVSQRRQIVRCGHNRRVQEGDPSVHGETDAFRKAGRQRRYRDTIMVTTLAPCWYCSGLVVQFRIGTVVVGSRVPFQGGIAGCANAASGGRPGIARVRADVRCVHRGES